jgi:anaerobic magnesium-protoporphyrin IX monomethyl ester cyclase
VKVLLVDPPFYRLIGFYNRYFPLGLVSVGTVLRDAGHEVAVYDADYNDRPSAMDYARLPRYYGRYLASFREPGHAIWREVEETIRRFQPDVVGISIWTTYAAAALHVARLSKQINPACPVIVGGPHATVKAEEILSVSADVDYVVRGEGEITARELLQALAASGRGAPPQSAVINPQSVMVPGVSGRADGSIRHGPPREKIRNLDELPLPDRTLLMNRDAYSPEDLGLVMTSRGCPFSCTFCVTETRQVRYRSVAHVLAEVRQVRGAYGTTQFSFKDDSFTVNRQRVLDFCDALTRKGLRIGWECNTRVDLVDEALLRAMKRAGCNSIKVGIESGSAEVLRRMNKGITLDQTRQAARLLRRAGIYWTGYFLIGTPGEMAQDIYRTRDFLYEIRPDFASIGVYEPFPGTAMFEEGLKRGLVKPDMTRDDFQATPPNDYYKTDACRQVDTMSQEQFEALEWELKALFHAYNKSPGRLWKRAKSRARLYLAQPAALVTDFRKYRKWI